MNNALILIDLLIKLTERATAISALLRTAQSEGRDVTQGELDALVAGDDKARAELEALIASKVAGNGT